MPLAPFQNEQHSRPGIQIYNTLEDSEVLTESGHEEMLFLIIQELRNTSIDLFVTDSYKEAAIALRNLVPSLLEFVPKYRTLLVEDGRVVL